MKKLSLETLKIKSKNIVSLGLMEKVTGGNKEKCHCTYQGLSESGADLWLCCD